MVKQQQDSKTLNFEQVPSSTASQQQGEGGIPFLRPETFNLVPETSNPKPVIRYAMSQGLGGVMIWEVGQDVHQTHVRNPSVHVRNPPLHVQSTTLTITDVRLF